MRSKPKFNKKKCLECKYHGERCGLGFSVKDENGKSHMVYCNYLCITNVSPITPGPNKTVVDLRGEDYDNCQLFVRGSYKEVE